MTENPKLITVFCSAEIPPNLLTTFLDEAYSASTGDVSYTFVTSNDLTAPLTPARSPVQDAIKTPGIEVCSHALVQLEESDRDDVEPGYFVVLDEHSLQERGCVIGDLTSNYVRCAFGISLLAVEALRNEQKRWPDLWFDAALSGGVISRQSYDGEEVQPGEYRSFTDREDAKRCIELHKQRDYGEQIVGKDQPYAVFVTADVPVSTLNELLITSEAHDLKGLCFLDTLEPDNEMKTTNPPIPDDFTSPFVGKDFSYIFEFVTDVLPNTSLQNEAFLVVDSLALPSSSPKPSVLHVDTKGGWQAEEDGDVLKDCFASRETFRTAFTSILESISSMDECAVEGALKGGIYDY